MTKTAAVGRRKSSVARVHIKPKGKGNITVNGKDYKEFFPIEFLQLAVAKPLAVTEFDGSFDFSCNVRGGGIKGQAEAVRLGIARALVMIDEELKPALRGEGLVTRDARVVERKKTGLRKARKKEQYSKR